MFRHHQFWIPTFNGHPYFVKPPLVYWLELLVFKIFGISIWGARLPIWILGLGLVWLTKRIGEILISKEAGLRAAVLLFSTILFFQYSQADMMDIPLTFFVIGCVYLFIRAHREHPGWLIPCGIGIGLASLVKGPIGSLLAVLSIVIYSSAYRAGFLFKRKEAWLSGLCCLFFALIWPFILWKKGYGPSWIHEFIFGENFGKFAGPVMPIKILWIGLLSGIAPWTFLFIDSVIRAFRKSEGRRREKLFFLGWGLCLFVVFMFPARKLPHYVLPVLPPACLLTASMESFSFLSLGLTRLLLAVMGIFWIIGIRLTDIMVVQAFLLAGGLSVLVATVFLRRAAALSFSALWVGFLLITLPVVIPAIELRGQNQALREISNSKLIGVFCPKDQDPRGFEMDPAFLSCDNLETAKALLNKGGVLIFSESDHAMLRKFPLSIKTQWQVWRGGIGLGQVIHAIWTANPSPLLETMTAAVAQN